MCTVCGCSDQRDKVFLPKIIHFGNGPAGMSIPGVSQPRTVKLERNILDANNRVADENRAHFRNYDIRALNLLSSPGSGKTTLLCKTLKELALRPHAVNVSVIEGDQQTSLDAERIQATGAPVVQVNTGKGCHLDARMVAEAFSKLHTHEHAKPYGTAPFRPQGCPTPLDTLTWQQKTSRQLLFIENVGNLVCPALWDLGEAAKIVILSVTEGEDKPLKYPDMFQKADLLLVNKIDLLPHVDFNPERALSLARSINPDLACLHISATTGEGMTAWIDWLLDENSSGNSSEKDTSALLNHRVETLESQLAAAKSALADNR